MWRNRSQRDEDCTRSVFLFSHWLQAGDISSSFNRKILKFSNINRKGCDHTARKWGRQDSNLVISGSKDCPRAGKGGPSPPGGWVSPLPWATLSISRCHLSPATHGRKRWRMPRSTAHLVLRYWVWVMEGVTSLRNCGSLFSPNGLGSEFKLSLSSRHGSESVEVAHCCGGGVCWEKGMEVTVGAGVHGTSCPGNPQHRAFGGGLRAPQRRHGRIRLQGLRRWEGIAPGRCTPSPPRVVFQDPACVLSERTAPVFTPWPLVGLINNSPG